MTSKDRVWISLDDTDPQIKYSGPWFPTEGVTTEMGANGQPFMRTLRGISSDGSLSFTFKGRSVALWGSVQPTNTTANGLDPDWQCMVDGVDVGKRWGYPAADFSNWAICFVENLADGVEHTFEMRAVVKSETLWVDQLQYLTPLTDEVADKWRWIGHADSRISYSQGWDMTEAGNRRWTNVTGANLTYEFSGTALLWGGYTPGPNSRDGLFTYIIDGQTPGKDVIIPHHDNNFAQNQQYFSVDNLTPGPHKLEIINKGNPSTMSLGLTHLYTKTIAEKSTSSSSNATGKIVGGTIGGFVGGLLFAVAAFFFLGFVRKRRSNKPMDESMVVAPPLLSQHTPPVQESMHTPNSFSSGPQSTVQGGGVVSMAQATTPPAVGTVHASWPAPQHQHQPQPPSPPYYPHLPQPQEDRGLGMQGSSMPGVGARVSTYLPPMDGRPGGEKGTYNPYL